MSATGNKIKGKLKEIEGKVTGDKLRQAEGSVQKAAGKVAAAVKNKVRGVKARAAMSKPGRKAAAAKAMP
ncbi:MAG TPA: CsbD family protein [Kofleriaceae bacterium]|jgi:uncharacterized protein YjbJ (UPF0337 family)